MSKTLNLCPVCDVERTGDLKIDGAGKTIGCACCLSFDILIAIANSVNEGKAFDTDLLVGAMLSSPLLHPWFMLRFELKEGDEKYYNKTYKELAGKEALV